MDTNSRKLILPFQLSKFNMLQVHTCFRAPDSFCVCKCQRRVPKWNFKAPTWWPRIGKDLLGQSIWAAFEPYIALQIKSNSYCKGRESCNSPNKYRRSSNKGTNWYEYVQLEALLFCSMWCHQIPINHTLSQKFLRCRIEHVPELFHVCKTNTPVKPCRKMSSQCHIVYSRFPRRLCSFIILRHTNGSKGKNSQLRESFSRKKCSRWGLCSASWWLRSCPVSIALQHPVCSPWTAGRRFASESSSAANSSIHRVTQTTSRKWQVHAGT